MVSRYNIGVSGETGQIRAYRRPDSEIFIDVVEEGFAKLSSAIKSSNERLSNAIQNAASVLYSGAHEIANELARQNKILEWDSLKKNISNNENWLYSKKKLKQFYETVDLENSYIPLIKTSFVGYIVVLLSMNKNCANLLSSLIKALCYKFYIHPIFAIHYIATSTGTIIWRDWYTPVVDYPDDDNPIKFGNLLGDLHRFAPNSNYFEIRSPEDSEIVLNAMLECAKEYDKIYDLELNIEWMKFFDSLNLEISFANLRMLNSKLEEFKRNIMVSN